jgi:glycosyltransferase involved in cell wall biosynthesis
VQNKVLEAMAMGLPVVLSPEAARGIDAADGKEFLIGDSDDALADAVVRLHNDGELRDTLSAAATAFTRHTMSWDAAMRDLPKILGFSPRPALHVA